MPKEMIGVRIPDRTLDRLEEYADSEGLSKSEAASRMIDQGLDVQESDMRLVKVTSDGGIEQQIEDVDEKLDSMNSAVSSDIQDYRADLKMFYVVLAFSLLWIGVAQIATVPWWVVVGTGSIVLVSVIYSFLVITGWFDE